MPPVEPLQPERPEMSGKLTEVTAVSLSEAVALSRKLPEPAGRKNCVFVAPS